jgi:hypothetical protein
VSRLVKGEGGLTGFGGFWGVAVAVVDRGDGEEASKQT